MATKNDDLSNLLSTVPRYPMSAKAKLISLYLVMLAALGIMAFIGALFLRIAVAVFFGLLGTWLATNPAPAPLVGSRRGGTKATVPEEPPKQGRRPRP